MRIRTPTCTPRLVLSLSLLFVSLLAGGVVARAQGQALLTPLRTGSSEQRGEGYDLRWWSVDSGGCTSSTGDVYMLASTIGQPDARALAGGGYTLAGGFWVDGAVDLGYDVCLPLVLLRP